MQTTATRHTAQPRSLQRGLSQIEGLIALAVAVVVLGAAIPNFGQARERRHIEGVAAQVRTAVMHARSLAISQDRSVRLRVESSAQGSCYVVHTGPQNSCSCLQPAQPVCTAAGRSFHAQYLAPAEAVALSANVGTMLFDPTLGTISPTGTLTVRGRSGAELRQVVSIMGRVRTCSPHGVVAGHPAC
jgi:type IV fimbrial biogenesis protein FimT